MVKRTKPKPKVAAAGSTDETHPGENKWAGVPPATCKSCEQTTHDVERDSSPDVPHYLLWHKTRTLKNGELGPCGVECYRCFDVRRRFFHQHTMQQLKDERVKARPVDDRFHELRADRVRGEGKFKDDEVVDVAGNRRFFEAHAGDPRSVLVNDVSGQPPAARGDRMTWLPAADAGLRVVGLSHLAVHISPDNPHYGASGTYRNCGSPPFRTEDG